MNLNLNTRINQLVQQHGSLRAVSRITGIDAGYLSYLRSGKKKAPSTSVLRKLGLRAVVEYELVSRLGNPR